MSSETPDIESPAQENEIKSEKSVAQETRTENKVASDQHSLNPKIVTVWKIENTIGLGILLLAVSAGGIALWTLTEAPKAMLIVIWLVVLGIFLSQLFWYPSHAYRNWSYLLTDQTLELRFGVVWEKSVLIPLSRLQHVDLHRGPLEQHFGLSSLEVHTAGTQNASHKIPGLEPEIAIRLRNELVQVARIENS